MSDHVFYQHGDEPDAANFAQAYGLTTLTNYIVDGFSFTVNTNGPTLDVESGHAVIQRASMTTATPNIDPAETREQTAHPVEADSRSALSLTDNTVNHVYLDVNVGSDDSPDIVTNTTGSEPTGESIKLGEVDTNNIGTSDPVVSDQWYLVSETGVLTFPNKPALDNAGVSSGGVLFDRSENELYLSTSFGPIALASQDYVDNSSSTLSDEEVEDIVASLVSSDENLSWTYDDSTDTLTVSLANTVSTSSLDATTRLSGPTATEGDTVTLPSNPDVVPIFFDAQTGQPLVPDLEETI